MRDVSAVLSSTWSRAAGWVRTEGWVLLQQAAAATVAWILAVHFVDHRLPFFAPIAAVVALNAPLGERGGNAVRLLQGVVIGILTGEVALGVLGATSWALFLGTLAGMASSRALGGTPVVGTQAAGAAILTITTADIGTGFDRLIDALVGGGVALVFSQILFAPEPVRLLRRAESAALSEIADAFDLTARAIDDNDQDLAGRAVDNLRDLRDRLAELGRIRHASRRVASRSAVWRARLGRVVQEIKSAGQLDLLGGSALMVVRTATAAEADEGDVLAPAIRDLAAQIRDLAQDPGDGGLRQRAADGVLQAVRRLQANERVHNASPDSALTATVVALRRAAADTMVFTGVDADQAAHAIQHGDTDVDVPTPASSLRRRFKRPRPPITRAEKYERRWPATHSVVHN